MRDNVYGTKHDYETELAELAEWVAHSDEECSGVPRCSYCLDEDYERDKVETECEK